MARINRIDTTFLRLINNGIDKIFYVLFSLDILCTDSTRQVNTETMIRNNNKEIIIIRYNFILNTEIYVVGEHGEQHFVWVNTVA